LVEKATSHMKNDKSEL